MGYLNTSRLPLPPVPAPLPQNWLRSSTDDAIHAAAAAGQPAAALALYDAARAAGHAPSPATFNALSTACARSGSIHLAGRAASLPEEMASCGASPDVVTYASLIALARRLGDAAAARRWFGDLLEAGLRPDAVALNTLVDAVGKAGDWWGAVRLLRSMEEAHGLAPDAYTYTAAVAACCRGGALEEALELFDEMGAKGLGPGRAVAPLVAALSKAVEASGASRGGRGSGGGGGGYLARRLQDLYEGFQQQPQQQPQPRPRPSQHPSHEVPSSPAAAAAAAAASATSPPSPDSPSMII